MKRFVVFALGGILVASHAGRAQAPGCAPSNVRHAEMIERFKVIVSATSPRSDDVRTALGIPLLPQDSVVAVADSITCAALSAAQAARYGDSAISVTAIKIGSTRYAVFDSGKKNGRFESMSVYNALYKFVVGVDW